MFKMSAFSFDARRESFAKDQNKSLLWIAVSSGRSFQIARASVFGSATFCGFGFSLLKLTEIILFRT